MNEQGPQYAEDQGRTVERVAALATVAGLVGLRLYLGGIGLSMRFCATLIFPLAAIWFADELAEGVSRSSGQLLSPLQAPTALRVAGWFCFGCFLVLLIVAW